MDSGTATTACATLRNNLKNPTITTPTSLDNVIIQSYTVTLTAAGGGSLPGPFTFATSALVPAGLVANNVLGGNTATFPVVLVPAGAKLDPRLRPPTRLPLVATAEVTFRGRDGRGTPVETEGAATVVFVSGSEEATPTCGTTHDTDHADDADDTDDDHTPRTGSDSRRRRTTLWRRQRRQRAITSGGARPPRRSPRRKRP